MLAESSIGIILNPFSPHLSFKVIKIGEICHRCPFFSILLDDNKPFTTKDFWYTSVHSILIRWHVTWPPLHRAAHDTLWAPSGGWVTGDYTASSAPRCTSDAERCLPTNLRTRWKHKIVQNNLIQPICMKIGISKHVKESTHLMYRLITLELSSCLYSFTWRSLGRQNNTSSTTMQRILNKRRSDCTMYSTRLVVYQFTF